MIEVQSRPSPTPTSDTALRESCCLGTRLCGEKHEQREHDIYHRSTVAMHERNRRSFCSAFLMVLATSLVVALWLYHRGLIPQPFDVPGSLLTNNAANTHFQARAAEGALLEVFQVYPPVLTVAEGDLLLTDGSSNASSVVVDSDPRYCQQTLVSYVFGNSYGSPFVAEYTAPACEFNRITWNLTVVSAGRQFDRLAIVYLGDLEVFRTSTAEPTASGIQWTYLKVSQVSAHVEAKLTPSGT